MILLWNCQVIIFFRQMAIVSTLPLVKNRRKNPDSRMILLWNCQVIIFFRQMAIVSGFHLDPLSIFKRRQIIKRAWSLEFFRRHKFAKQLITWFMKCRNKDLFKKLIKNLWNDYQNNSYPNYFFHKFFKNDATAHDPTLFTEFTSRIWRTTFSSKQPWGHTIFIWLEWSETTNEIDL